MDPRHTNAEDEQFLLNMIGEGQGDVAEYYEYYMNVFSYFHLNLYEYYECFFIAVCIIVAAEKDEARPDKKTGRAVHYNGSCSRW